MYLIRVVKIGHSAYLWSALSNYELRQIEVKNLVKNEFENYCLSSMLIGNWIFGQIYHVFF